MPRRRAGGAEVAELALDVTEPDAGERSWPPARTLRPARRAGQQRRHRARARDLDEVPEADWYAAWELNVMAPLRLMRAAAPAMAERGWGRVVNVSSSAGKRPVGADGRVLGGEGRASSRSRACSPTATPRDGVLVNAVCPGPTKSELWMDEGGLLDQSQPSTPATTTASSALADGRRAAGRSAGWPRVEEIAAAIVFLCSERASYVAGAAWSVDGGTVQVII